MADRSHGDAEYADGERSTRRARDPGTVIAAVLFVGLAWFLWSGTMHAGWISEDTSVVRRLLERGPLDDWFGSQYGASAIRFWRPLVSTTMWIQLELFGPDAFALRVFDAVAHAVGALFLYRLARALGCSTVGGLTGALMTFAFPHQGGTVTWVVGRVDALCWPLVVGTALAAVRGRTSTAATCAFLALATKEMGAAAAPFAVACAWAAPRERCPDAARGAFLACVGTAAALLMRTTALGTLVGGYPTASSFPDFDGPWSLFVAVWSWIGSWMAALWNGVAATGPLVFALPFAIALSYAGGRLRSGVVMASLGAHLASLVVVASLLRNGGPTPEHTRWMLVPDGILCLAWAGCFGVGPWLREIARGIPSAIAVVLALSVFVDRALRARTSTTIGPPPPSRPPTSPAPSRTSSSASLRTAARSSRSIRPASTPGAGVPAPLRTSRSLPSAARKRAARGLALAPDLRRTDLPPARRRHRRRGAGRVLLPENFATDLTLDGPDTVAIAGVDTGGALYRVEDDAGLVAVLVCELGFDVAPLPPQPASGYTLEAIFGSVGRTTELWRTLMLASDFGARRVELFFALPDGRATRWVEVGWDEDTVRALAPRLGH
ncbi:MAG: hypothetical protein R3F34_02705 [Planctomycetota bacterium]